MHDSLALYLLAVLLSLGRLVLGELISKNDLNTFLASHENLSMFYDIIKVRRDGPWKFRLGDFQVSNLMFDIGLPESPRRGPLYGRNLPDTRQSSFRQAYGLGSRQRSPGDQHPPISHFARNDACQHH